MATGDLHLSVHLGDRWTAAVVTIGGQLWPVTFDGHARTPSGVYLEPQTGEALTAGAGHAAAKTHPEAFLPNPMDALRSSADDAGGPATAVGALLAYVATVASAQAGAAVTTLTVTTAQPWGPKSRHRLARAATTVGLPEPAIVTTAAAAAATLTAAPTPGPQAERGRFMLVCAITDDYPTVTVIEGTDYTQLATTVARAPDVPGISDALAAMARQRAATDDISAAVDWRGTAEIDRARTALAGEQRTPVLLPGQAAPVILDIGDLTKAAQPHLDHLAPAISRALTDADIDHADITGTVLICYDGTASLAETALVNAGLPPPNTLTQPDQLAASAAHLTAGSQPGNLPTAATTRLPRTRLTLRSLTAVAVLAVASVALLIQTVSTADIAKISITIVGARLPLENLALAAALAATVATAAAQLAPTTWLTPKGMADPASTGHILRRAYLAAAATGLAAGGLWGLGAGVGVGYSDNRDLRWALGAAIPIAGCAAIVSIIAPRIPTARLSTWLPQMSPPLWPITLAAAGVYLVRSAFTLTFPTNLTGSPGIIAATGAAALGAATAATATRQPWLRAVTGLLLVPGYALIATVDTITYLTTTYIAALIWWHLTATTHTLRAAVPDGHPVARWLGKT